MVGSAKQFTKKSISFRPFRPTGAVNRFAYIVGFLHELLMPHARFTSGMVTAKFMSQSKTRFISARKDLHTAS